MHIGSTLRGEDWQVGEGGGKEGSEDDDDELDVGHSSWTTVSLADFAGADMFKIEGACPL